MASELDSAGSLATQSMVHRLAAPASASLAWVAPGEDLRGNAIVRNANLLEMQILESYPRPIESESDCGGMGW